MLTTLSGEHPFARLAHTGTLPPRVREIFGIPWSERHEAAFRAVASGHRRARHLFPRRLRRGRNDVFFDSVTRSERRRGGTRTPDLTP
jgi:uncharacterized protein (DUF2236 family)